MWSTLIMTLPTQPNAVRLRIWRNLKALGCAALRDGAYLLPEEQAGLLAPIAAEVREHGGTAMLLTLTAPDSAQRQEIEALFDRTEAFTQWRDTASALQAELAQLTETEARRRQRNVADALQALHRIDYYPGAAAAQADADMASLRQALDACFSRGEPAALPAHGIKRLDTAQFQNQRWATRARPWVDRLACAWLIRRFVDPGARFVWLADPASPPADVLGFDFDGARFTHVGALVTFEVLIASFGLEADPRLQRLARAVHYLDTGGMPVPEAAGLEAVLAGLREGHADDDALAQAAAQVFDALYAVPRTPPLRPGPPHPRKLWRGLPVLAQARFHQLWRACGPDCDHACRAGGAPPLDQRKAISARPQLLHAAARPRGAAAGHLHRLAHAPHLGRHRGRGAVCTAFALHPDRAVVGVPAVWRRARGGRHLLRHQARCDRAGAACGPPHRHAGSQKRLDVGHCGCVFCGHLCAQHALPGHRAGRRAHRLLWCAALACRVRSGRRPCQRPQGLWPGVDRRRHAHACPCPLLAQPPGQGARSRAGAVARGHGRAGGHAGLAGHAHADGLVLH